MNVYDFDKTIYKDDSSHDFYLFNLKKNPIILIHGIRQLLAFIAYSLHLITKTEMKTIFYTYFKSIKNMDESSKKPESNSNPSPDPVISNKDTRYFQS
jgi:hypothetical protein